MQRQSDKNSDSQDHDGSHKPRDDDRAEQSTQRAQLTSLPQGTHEGSLILWNMASCLHVLHLPSTSPLSKEPVSQHVQSAVATAVIVMPDLPPESLKESYVIHVGKVNRSL